MIRSSHLKVKIKCFLRHIFSGTHSRHSKMVNDATSRSPSLSSTSTSSPSPTSIGVYFNNILWPVLHGQVPKAQKIWSSRQFFAPLGSAWVKASRKTLVVTRSKRRRQWKNRTEEKGKSRWKWSRRNNDNDANAIFRRQRRYGRRRKWRHKNVGEQQQVSISPTFHEQLFVLRPQKDFGIFVRKSCL